MCGRYASFLPAEALQRIFGTTNPLPNIEPSWNLAPTQSAPVVRRHPETGARHLDLLTWGLLPYFTKDPKHSRRPINARAETLATSGMFRSAFARRRCLIPAAAFYEWKKTGSAKQPYAVARADGAPLALGGIWEGWRGAEGGTERSFAIITVPASHDIAELHDRMPLILESADWPVWLGEIEADPAALLHPPPEHALKMWPVPAAVNSPKNNGPELLIPLHQPAVPELKLT
jgi:putative SOS response-associated peptidase YedK